MQKTLKPPAPSSGIERIKRLLGALRYSVSGFREVYRSEAAFRDELILTVVSLSIGWFVKNEVGDYFLLIAAHLLVLAVELLNSAVEAVVDLVSPGYHALAGRAKDAGSAAVLCTLILVLLAWCNLFI